MSDWRIALTFQARKQIASLDAEMRQRVLNRLKTLPEGEVKKLRGGSKLLRARVGDWRILFRADYASEAIEVAVAKRDKAYR